MRQTRMLLSSLVCMIAIGVPTSDRLLSATTLTCADWAQVANEYIAMGQDKAVAQLVKISNGADGGRTGFENNTRTCLLGRLIFDPNGKDPLRPPMLGGLPLPYHSMPASDWPHYPFVKVDDVPFLLSEGYILAGAAEPCKDYLAYCMKNGTFRTKPYAVPTSTNAKEALKKLYTEDRWHNLKWSYQSANEGYNISPRMVKNYLEEQTLIKD